jgi:hypothetical protein
MDVFYRLIKKKVFETRRPPFEEMLPASRPLYPRLAQTPVDSAKRV